MLVDSHCHLNLLDLTQYHGDLSAALIDARAQGVEHFLCVSVKLEEMSTLLGFTQQFSDVTVSVGEHPNERPEVIITVEELKTWGSDPRVIAIGETGLDYYRSQGDMEWQRERFRTHIRAAKELAKPIIVHTRNAKEDTLQILQEENAKEVRGVLHCFTEDLDMALRAIDLDFYISFSGIVTFKNAAELQAIAKALPLDRILVETDCPFLAPIPFRGKPNFPGYVRHTAEFIAELRGIPLEILAKQTTDNFYRLFKV